MDNSALLPDAQKLFRLCSPQIRSQYSHIKSKVKDAISPQIGNGAKKDKKGL